MTGAAPSRPTRNDKLGGEPGQNGSKRGGNREPRRREVAASDKTSAKANGKDANKRGGRGTNTRRRNAAAFIKAKVQSALKKRAKEKITVSTFIAQNHHIFFAAGFCLLAIFVAALMKVKDISPGALRKEIAAYKSQNSVLKNEVNLVHQENAVLYNRILTLHNHLMRASSQYTRWHTALNEDLIRAGEEQIRPYTAVVPEGVAPGSGFEVVVDGQIYLVSCPKGGKPGDTVAFDLLAQVLSQVVDGGLVNAAPMVSSDLRKSWKVVGRKTNITRLSQGLASPRVHWIKMREQSLPKLVDKMSQVASPPEGGEGQGGEGGGDGKGGGGEQPGGLGKSDNGARTDDAASGDGAAAAASSQS